MRPAVRTTFQVFAFVLLAAVAIFMLPQYHHSKQLEYEVNQPWNHAQLVADFDFQILKTQEQIDAEKKEIELGFVPIFNHEPTADIPEELVMSIQDKQMLEEKGWRVIEVSSINNTSRRIPLSQLMVNTDKRLSQRFHKKVMPTLHFDEQKTNGTIVALQQSVANTQGWAKAGTVIVDRGDMVTDEVAQKIFSFQQALEGQKTTSSELMLYLVGCGVSIVLLLSLFFLYLYIYRRKWLDDMRHVLFFAILLCIVIVASYLLLSYTQRMDFIYLVPFVWVPIITRVFYDSRTAVFLHVVTMCIVSVAVPNPYQFLLIQLAAGIVSVISLRDMTQRAQLATTAAFVLLTYGVMYTAFQLMVHAGFSQLDWRLYVFFVVNAVLVVCAYGLIFLFERTFGLLSSITLVELTNVNSNLMLQFAEQAPGTFQHSMQVSNLATEAAKRIGAKVLLVRTGALYHDIGKMSHPEYFIENQAGGYNPLLEMSNKQAASVIIDHVTEGERIARRHKLPEVIIHFIRSHHGDSQTRYFYNTAINEAKQAGMDPSVVNIADYTYPGPRPTTKEAAILTIADAVEARSRSLKEMTPQSISDMVDDMVDILIRDGQLSETPLSFKDLEEIRKVFKQKLMEMNHHRITYPKVEE
jgi:putative nucleotidyltransferase with HDIG domain